MTPSSSELWFLPLGGCGEIGMNLNLYGHNGQWLMVDCGVTFANPGETGPHVQMANPQFIAERADALSALLITHAHEDHLGAVAHLWPRLRCPVYATPFAAAILRRKLAEAGLLEQLPLYEVSPRQLQRFGEFHVQWLPLTHSTPESHALLISTPVGKILHTGDWKIDTMPVVGDAMAAETFSTLAQQDVLAIVCDSTNALEPGRSVSEGQLGPGLSHWIGDASGRVVVGCFGSNVARLRTLCEIAATTGRYPGLLGRSLHNYFAAAQYAGLWPADLPLIEPAHLGYLPPAEVLAIATGSQGEPRAALQRLALDTHPDLTLEPGDTVLLSARTIPGNEVAVQRLLQQFASKGVRVIQDEMLNMPIHASGHPCQEELADMYRWVSPRIAVPVHGEVAHMQENARVAASAGVPQQMVGVNGDLFMFAPQRGIRRQAVTTGRLGLGGRGLEAVAHAPPTLLPQ